MLETKGKMSVADRERMLRLHDTSLMLRITEGRTPEGSIDGSIPPEDIRNSIAVETAPSIPDRLSSIHSSMSESTDSQVSKAPFVAPQNEFSITDQWGSIETQIEMQQSS